MFIQQFINKYEKRGLKANSCFSKVLEAGGGRSAGNQHQNGCSGALIYALC